MLEAATVERAGNEPSLAFKKQQKDSKKTRGEHNMWKLVSADENRSPNKNSSDQQFVKKKKPRRNILYTFNWSKLTQNINNKYKK